MKIGVILFPALGAFGPIFLTFGGITATVGALMTAAALLIAFRLQVALFRRLDLLEARLPKDQSGT